MSLPANLQWLTARQLSQAWNIARAKGSAWERDRVLGEYRRRGMRPPADRKRVR